MRRLGLMLLLAATIHIVASAQETTGTITGVTTDQSGEVVPGVTVTIRNTGTGLTRTVVTNTTGNYTASLLPIGTYTVVFDLQEFASKTLENIVLHVNDRLQLDGRMEVAKLSDTVQLSAIRTLRPADQPKNMQHFQ